jgi:hypothetical protein
MKAQSSRLSQLVRDSSHVRRFSSDWYKIRERKDHLLGSGSFEAIRIRGVEEPYSLGSLSVREQELEWRAMEDEIKAACYILRIQNEEGSEEYVPYTRETLDRATGFLTRQMIHAHSARVVGMGVPRICPADRGSIDLYWEKNDRTLLVNFLPGSQVANYYGRKPKSEISGRFDPAEARVELVSWLADQ